MNGNAGGSATISGSIVNLAAGQSDKSSLSVGLATTTVGRQTGIVLLQASSAGAVGGDTMLPTSPGGDANSFVLDFGVVK